LQATYYANMSVHQLFHWVFRVSFAKVAWSFERLCWILDEPMFACIQIWVLYSSKEAFTTEIELN
jgi:hypothetical protein